MEGGLPLNAADSEGGISCRAVPGNPNSTAEGSRAGSSSSFLPMIRFFQQSKDYGFRGFDGLASARALPRELGSTGRPSAAAVALVGESDSVGGCEERSSRAGIALDSADSGPVSASCRIPEPRADELLVSVRASSVNGIDRAIALGRLLATTEHEFPVVLGHDFAGVVERMGRDVATFWEGDEVYGFAYTPKLDARSGTWADCIVVPERSCSRRADNSGHSARRPPADT